MSVVKPVWLKQFRGVCHLAVPDTILPGFPEDANHICISTVHRVF